MKVLTCIAYEHDLRLVALACLICTLSCVTATTCMARLCDPDTLHRRRVLAGAATMFGCGVWSLHFVAMLAFLPGAEMAYDTERTITSALFACGGAFLALLVWGDARAAMPRIIFGGVLLGLTIVGMHYRGIAAIRFSGLFIVDNGYLAASIVLSALFSIAALARTARLGTISGQIEVGTWLALAICGTHFLGMTAITVAPGTAEVTDKTILGTAQLAYVVGGVTVAILLASLAATLLQRQIAQGKRDEARIRHIACHDALTDLPNRYALHKRLEDTLATAAQAGTAVAILYIDLDRFKPVNDSYGHAVGDIVLVSAAHSILAQTRPTDTLARVGGDEFVMVLASEPDRASAIAAKTVEAVQLPIQVEGRRIEIGASVGIARFPNDGTDVDALMRAADAAMYRAKQEGRGAVRLFDPATHAELQARLQLEQEMAGAAERGEFVLHYQPIVNGVTGDVETCEALVRWNHPTRGLLLPLMFIPLAEATGHIDAIGRWVIATACREAATWPYPWRISINVSPVQFRQTDVCGAIAAALAGNRLEPARVVIEVTESVLVDDADKAVEILNRLRGMGVRVALDDFGTGYSSLSYLQLFKFDKFKVDKSFVKRLGASEEALTITRTIVNLGHNLGLQVTAEGVETPEQLAIVRMLGCDQVQGYLLACPAPLAGFTDLDRLRIKALFGPQKLLSIAS